MLLCNCTWEPLNISPCIIFTGQWYSWLRPVSFDESYLETALHNSLWFCFFLPLPPPSAVWQWIHHTPQCLRNWRKSVKTISYQCGLLCNCYTVCVCVPYWGTLVCSSGGVWWQQGGGLCRVGAAADLWGYRQNMSEWQQKHAIRNHPHTFTSIYAVSSENIQASSTFAHFTVNFNWN